MEALDAAGAAASTVDLSIWGLFWQADLVVKAQPDGYTIFVGDFGPSVLAGAQLIHYFAGVLHELRLLEIRHAGGVERPVGAGDFEKVRFALADEFAHGDLINRQASP